MTEDLQRLIHYSPGDFDPPPEAEPVEEFRRAAEKRGDDLPPALAKIRDELNQFDDQSGTSIAGQFSQALATARAKIRKVDSDFRSREEDLQRRIQAGELTDQGTQRERQRLNQEKAEAAKEAVEEALESEEKILNRFQAGEQDFTGTLDADRVSMYLGQLGALQPKNRPAFLLEEASRLAEAGKVAEARGLAQIARPLIAEYWSEVDLDETVEGSPALDAHRLVTLAGLGNPGVVGRTRAVHLARQLRDEVASELDALGESSDVADMRRRMNDQKQFLTAGGEGS